MSNNRCISSASKRQGPKRFSKAQNSQNQAISTRLALTATATATPPRHAALGRSRVRALTPLPLVRLHTRATSSSSPRLVLLAPPPSRLAPIARRGWQRSRAGEAPRPSSGGAPTQCRDMRTAAWVASAPRRSRRRRLHPRGRLGPALAGAAGRPRSRVR
jgi:hypothetical protein